jgi:Transglycosylase SLT domain
MPFSEWRGIGLGYMPMMRRLIRHWLVKHKGPRAPARLPIPPARGSLMLRGMAGCSALVLVGVGAYTGIIRPAPGSDQALVTVPKATPSAATSFRQIILPDLLVVLRTGLSTQQLTSLAKIKGVRNMIAFDGAEIKAGRQAVSVIGVNPAQFRSWVPLQTASDQPFWTALAGGEFVASQTARTDLRLRSGASYRLAGTTSQTVRFGASAALGIEGVDLLVDSQVSTKLGLVHRVAALISAPGAGLTGLIAKVKAVLGPSGEIVNLRQQQLQVSEPTSVPSSDTAPSQLPTTYLQLFKESAAKYCPGLSWTVLAAIGQIESGDGANEGPSPAGALGLMQFLPSTWAIWGIDGFGQTGTPNIWDPYDAVPSAANLLCADGAAAGGTSLADAIFDYNHANWYVSEVLALAAEYAQDYS